MYARHVYTLASVYIFHRLIEKIGSLRRPITRSRRFWPLRSRDNVHLVPTIASGHAPASAPAPKELQAHSLGCK